MNGIADLGRRSSANKWVLGALSTAVLVTTTFGVAAMPVCLIVTGVAAVLSTLSQPNEASGCAHPLALDYAVALWVVGTWFSFRVAGQPSAGTEDLAIVLVAALQFYVLRNWRVRLDAMCSAVLATGVLLIAGASLRAFAERYRVWRDLGFSQPELFRHQLTLFSGNQWLGNPIGTYVVMIGVCIALTALAGGAERKRVRQAVRALGWAGATTVAMLLVVTFSRAIYVAVSAGVVYGVVVLVRLRALPSVPARWKLMETGLCVLGVLLFYDVARPAARVLSLSERTVTEQRSNAGRLATYEFALGVWRKDPVMGIGPGRFGQVSAKGLARSGSPLVSQAFNTFLQVGAERGVLAAVGLVAVFAAGIALPFGRGVMERTSIAERSAIAALGGGVTSAAIYNLFWSSMLVGVSASASALAAIAILANLCDADA